MKVFITFATLVAAAFASPSQLAVLPVQSYLLPGLSAAAPAQAQYHAQDSFGQYRYGYSDGLSAKEEIKTLDGITRGSYSYVDANGELQSVDYSADALNGFRVAGTNLPKAPKDLPILKQNLPQQVEETPEVAQAKAAHFAAHQEAKIRSNDYRPAEQIYDMKDLPKQVEDTAEVAKAKADHLAALKHAELRNSAIEEVRAAPVYQANFGVYSYSPQIAAVPSFKATVAPAAPLLAASYIPQSYSYSPLALNPRFLTRSFVY